MTTLIATGSEDDRWTNTAIFGLASDRLRFMMDRMLANYSACELLYSEDFLQNVNDRIWNGLSNLSQETARNRCRLIARHLGHELIYIADRICYLNHPRRLLILEKESEYHKIVEGLPVHLQELFAISHYLAMPHRDVAQLLDISLDTLKDDLTKASHMLLTMTNRAIKSEY